MQVSYSRIECYKKCPFQYKLRYIDKLKTYFNNDPANPLIIGTALHTGIEQSVEEAIEWYYKQYPIINDQIIEEAIKLESVIPKCREILPQGEYELKIECDDFIGYMDLLAPIGKDEEGHEWYDLYDFKYSNNVDNYLKSGQLHVYKWFFEKLNPTKHIRNMYFLFAPKVAIKMKYKNKTNKRDETIEEFRQRLRLELQTKTAQLVEVAYDYEKVIEFLTEAKNCKMAQNFNKNKTHLCSWCEFRKFCEEGEELEIMNLPKNERRTVEANSYKKIWLYGAPFSGKTYLANKFPNVLMLNTDGNIKYVDAPFIPIKDIVTISGRVTNRIQAWEVFKDTIAELEKEQNDYETIVVDLLEDTYEHCRLYCYKKLGIEHESDNSFKAWDYVKTEFLSTIKRLMGLDYNILLLSHEDTSKDLTKKSGDKITAIKPNLQDKAALKIAGMVDIVGRVINDEGVRTISFKTNEVVFGGGRLNLTSSDIPCEYDDLMGVYTNNQVAKENAKTSENKAQTTRKTRTPKAEEPKQEIIDTIPEKVEEALEPIEEIIGVEEVEIVEEKPTMARKTRTLAEKVEEFKEQKTEEKEAVQEEQAPVRRVRRRVAE